MEGYAVQAVTRQQIEEGQAKYRDFLNDKAGHFYTHLFNAIAFADHMNMKKLAKIFPGEVYVYLVYIGEVDEKGEPSGRAKFTVVN